MSRMLSSAEQRAAIDHRDGDLLLSAAAGSGKTSVMVERYVRAACEDGAAIGSLLAITFTEKAAAQLRERIVTRLRDAGSEDLAREAQSAWISTIHGFCARLLRADPLPAGVDPLFTVLDERQSDALAREAAAAALDELVRDRGAQATELAARYTAPRLRAAIVAAHGRMRSRGLEARLPDPPPPRDAVRARDRLRRACREAGDELAACASGAAAVAKARAALEACEALLGGGGDGGEAGDGGGPGSAHGGEPPLPWALEPCALGNGAGALKTDTCQRYRDAYDDYVAACADHHARRFYALIDDLLRRFARLYERAKASRGVLDFNDLELRARDLLAGNEPIRRRYGERFALVMVDEFQDTNPLQLDIVRAIGAGRLFTVGDERQSIYRFRNADVAVFRDLRRELSAAGGALELGASFRAPPEILDVLNQALVAEQAFGAEFAPLRAARTAPAPATPAVELLLTDVPGARDGREWDRAKLMPADEPELAAPWRMAEARLLADRVRALVDAGRAPGEIAVLLRATGDLATFERALEDRDLPTYVIGGRGYWGRREVQDLVAWLALLANPLDERRLYEALASPLAGVASSALVALAAAARERESDPWTTLRAAFGTRGVAGDAAASPLLTVPSSADRERLRRFVALLDGERPAAARRPLEALIERALTATGYDLAILRMHGGRRRLANVRKLMRVAREFEAREGGDLRALLDFVADLGGDEGLADPRESEAPLETEGLDAIRLMTIHAAKGLEFPVVCVADLGRQRPSNTQALIVGPRGRVGIKLPNPGPGRNIPALGYEQIAEAEASAESEEERRLFYVAMTRAQDHLILSGSAAFGKLAGNGRRDAGAPPAVAEAWREPVGWIAGSLLDAVGERVRELVGRKGDCDGAADDLPAGPITTHETVTWEDRTAGVALTLNIAPPAGDAPAGGAGRGAAPAAEGEPAAEPGAEPAAEPGVPREPTAVPPVADASGEAPAADAATAAEPAAPRLFDVAALEGGPPRTPPSAAAAPEGAPAARSPRADAASIEPPSPPPAGAAPPRAISYSALQQYGRCGYRFYLSRVLRLPGSAVGEARSDGARGAADAAPGSPAGGLSGLALGTIVHALMERLDFAAPAAPCRAAIAAAARRHDLRIGDREQAAVAELIGAFAASSLCARLAAAGDVRREVPFAFALDAEPSAAAGEPPLVNGVLDALAWEGERALVVDYKSDRLAEGAAVADVVARDYAIQRLVYALALLRSGAPEVEVVHVFLARPDELATRRFGAADAAELERELRALAGALAAGDFAVSEQPNRALCDGCPGRGTLCSWPLRDTWGEPPS